MHFINLLIKLIFNNYFMNYNFIKNKEKLLGFKNMNQSIRNEVSILSYREK